MRILVYALDDDGEISHKDPVQWLVGRFDDESGSSLKFFISEGGDIKKVVFFDGEKVAVQKFKSKASLALNFENLENLTKAEALNLIDALTEESLSQ